MHNYAAAANTYLAAKRIIHGGPRHPIFPDMRPTPVGAWEGPWRAVGALSPTIDVVKTVGDRTNAVVVHRKDKRSVIHGRS